MLPFAPSAQVRDLLSTVSANPLARAGMLAIAERSSEFASPDAATLTGIALDPNGREFADQLMDSYWSDEDRRKDALDLSPIDREVIIGSGFHAAVYAATRVLSGHPRPLVLERDARVGGGTATQWSRPPVAGWAGIVPG